LTWVNGVARYLASEGREVVVHPEQGVLETDLRTLLLCSPMGGLLHQCGVLPLHASAIVTPIGAVLFMGHSGRGKSTLAAHFRERGFAVLADDIAVIRFDGQGRPWVEPGLPQFKLWPNSLKELGQAADALPRLRPTMEKRTLAFRDSFCRESVPLARIYSLDTDTAARDFVLTELPMLNRVRHLLEHTYRVQYLPGLGLQRAHFVRLTQIAAAVKVVRAVRPDNGTFQLTAFANRLAGDFGA
jgi:hypothetical protein